MRKLTFSRHLLDNVITAMFALLPLVDSANGFLASRGIGFSLGTLYKLALCCILVLPLLRTNRIRSHVLLPVLASILLITFSICWNLLVLKAEGFQSDFPIKLLFNILTLVLLLENLASGAITGRSLFRVLDLSAWLLSLCFLVPYALGMGSSVYHGMGFKAFFISQNELSLIIICLFYFCLYKLTLRLQAAAVLQVGLLLLCGLLLNTKSTILACLLGAGVYAVYILIKIPLRIRLFAIAGLMLALFVFKDTITKVVANVMDRLIWMLNNNYGGSVTSTLLSGRDAFLLEAWDALSKDHLFFRLFFGNGFCSVKLVEMDVVDIFFFLGFFGAAGTVFFLGYALVKCIRNCRKDPTPIRILSYLMILFFLNITGHVLFMAMSGCYFVVYLCFLIHFRPEAPKTAIYTDTLEGMTVEE